MNWLYKRDNLFVLESWLLARANLLKVQKIAPFSDYLGPGYVAFGLLIFLNQQRFKQIEIVQ